MTESRAHRLNNAKKVRVFRSFFSGLTKVYGTYDPATQIAWQVQEPVRDAVILDHLRGNRPYGVYLLDGDRTRAVVADFDDLDSCPPTEFVNAAKHYGLASYIEISKSKGFHVWIFFNGRGIRAVKARAIVKHILGEIGVPQTEIFPKQDRLDGSNSGNFINAPLFGLLVPKGKTVFIDPYTFKPYADQWVFLRSVERINEGVLDDIIEINEILLPRRQIEKELRDSSIGDINRFRLPPCAQRMLQDGVTQNQRVSCFRLAIHLKRLGLPHDVSVAALKRWSIKNQPGNGRRIMTEAGIINQVSSAYDKEYRGYGCDTEAVAPFCHPDCSVHRRVDDGHEHGVGNLAR